MMEVVLASASPRRRQLLEQVGVAVQVIPSSASEDGGGPPAEAVVANAVAKATQVAAALGGGKLVVAADTAVVVDDRVLGKPASQLQAVEMLCQLAGRWHRVLTGLAVMQSPSGTPLTGVEVTRVLMRPFTPALARQYVATQEPMDKAGAYGIQGRGALLVERVDGCYFNVVGLPLVHLFHLLSQCGWVVPWAPDWQWLAGEGDGP